jgi:cbb3-type cytochrome oxidase maturation protein
MTILYLILPLALCFAGAAVVAFAWTVRSGQLDDIETPPHRILFDDEPRPALSESGPAQRAARRPAELTPPGVRGCAAVRPRARRTS